MVAGTLLWKESDAVSEECLPELLREGQGLFFKINDKTFRLSDPEKQMDLMISKLLIGNNECNLTLEEDQFWVKEMPGVVATIITAEVTTENDQLSFTAKNRTSRNFKDDVDMTSHLNYIRNQMTDNENKLVNTINHVICESDGWLAAKQLSFPLCSKLVPIGETALLEQCRAISTNTSTIVTKCGP
jgi:hypothetical protein